MKPPLTLKHHTGWFAAGREMQQALALLSDGAFKLYVYVCLHAERSSGRLPFHHSELARSLGKSPRSITSYLKELQRQGVCQVQAAANQHQRGSIEIVDRFWPYHKQLSETPLSDQTSYIEQVRRLFLSRACVQGTFSAVDLLWSCISVTCRWSGSSALICSAAPASTSRCSTIRARRSFPACTTSPRCSVSWRS